MLVVEGLGPDELFPPQDQEGVPAPWKQHIQRNAAGVAEQCLLALQGSSAPSHAIETFILGIAHCLTHSRPRVTLQAAVVLGLPRFLDEFPEAAGFALASCGELPAELQDSCARLWIPPLVVKALSTGEISSAWVSAACAVLGALGSLPPPLSISLPDCKAADAGAGSAERSVAQRMVSGVLIEEVTSLVRRLRASVGGAAPGDTAAHASAPASEDLSGDHDGGRAARSNWFEEAEVPVSILEPSLELSKAARGLGTATVCVLLTRGGSLAEGEHAVKGHWQGVLGKLITSVDVASPSVATVALFCAAAPRLGAVPCQALSERMVRWSRAWEGQGPEWQTILECSRLQSPSVVAGVALAALCQAPVSALDGAAQTVCSRAPLSAIRGLLDPFLDQPDAPSWSDAASLLLAGLAATDRPEQERDSSLALRAVQAACRGSPGIQTTWAALLQACRAIGEEQVRAQAWSSMLESSLWAKVRTSGSCVVLADSLMAACVWPSDEGCASAHALGDQAAQALVHRLQTDCAQAARAVRDLLATLDDSTADATSTAAARARLLQSGMVQGLVQLACGEETAQTLKGMGFDVAEACLGVLGPGGAGVRRAQAALEPAWLASHLHALVSCCSVSSVGKLCLTLCCWAESPQAGGLCGVTWHCAADRRSGPFELAVTQEGVDEAASRSQSRYILCAHVGWARPLLELLSCISPEAACDVLRTLEWAARVSDTVASTWSCPAFTNSLLGLMATASVDVLPCVTTLCVALFDFRCTAEDVTTLLACSVLPTAASTAVRMKDKAAKKVEAARMARARAAREAAALSATSPQNSSSLAWESSLSEPAVARQGSLAILQRYEDLQLQLLFMIGCLLESPLQPPLSGWVGRAVTSGHLLPVAPHDGPGLNLALWIRPELSPLHHADHVQVIASECATGRLSVELHAAKGGCMLVLCFHALHGQTWQEVARIAFPEFVLPGQGAQWHHIGLSICSVEHSNGVSAGLWVNTSEVARKVAPLPDLSVDDLARAPWSLCGTCGLGAYTGGIGCVVLAAGPSWTPQVLHELRAWPSPSAQLGGSEQESLAATLSAANLTPTAVWGVLTGGQPQRGSGQPQALAAAHSSTPRTGSDAPGESSATTNTSLPNPVPRPRIRDSMLAVATTQPALSLEGDSGAASGADMRLGLLTALLPMLTASPRQQQAALRVVVQLVGRPAPGLSTPSLGEWWSGNDGFAALEYVLLSQLQRCRIKFANLQSSMIEAISFASPDMTSPFSDSAPVETHRESTLAAMLWSREAFAELFDMMPADSACSGAADAYASARGGAVDSAASSTTQSTSVPSMLGGRTAQRRTLLRHASGGARRLTQGAALDLILSLLPFCDAVMVTGATQAPAVRGSVSDSALSLVARRLTGVQAKVGDEVAESLLEDAASLEAWFALRDKASSQRGVGDGPGLARLLDLLRLAYPHLLPPSPLADGLLVPTEEIALLSQGNRRLRTPLLAALRRSLLHCGQGGPSSPSKYQTLPLVDAAAFVSFLHAAASQSKASTTAGAGSLAMVADVVSTLLMGLMSAGGTVLLQRIIDASDNIWTLPMVLLDCSLPAVRCSGIKLLSVLLQRQGKHAEACAFIVAGGVHAVAASLARWSITSDIVQALLGLIAGYFRAGVDPTDPASGGLGGLRREGSKGSLAGSSDHGSRRFNAWHHGSELSFEQPAFLNALFMLLAHCRDGQVVLRALSDIERAVSVSRTAAAHENISAWLSTGNWFRSLCSFEAAWRDGGYASASSLAQLASAMYDGPEGAAAGDRGLTLPGSSVRHPVFASADGTSTVSSSLLDMELLGGHTELAATRAASDVAAGSGREGQEDATSGIGAGSAHTAGVPARSLEGSDSTTGRVEARDACLGDAPAADGGGVSVDGSLGHEPFGSGSVGDAIVAGVHALLQLVLVHDLHMRSSSRSKYANGALGQQSFSTVHAALGQGKGWQDILKSSDDAAMQVAALRAVLHGIHRDARLPGDTAETFAVSFSKLVRSIVSLLGHMCPSSLFVHAVGIINLLTMTNPPEVRSKLSSAGLMGTRDLLCVTMLQRCGAALDAEAEVVAALEPAFESVAVNCAAHIKECSGSVRLLHLALLAAKAGERDFAAVMLRMCGAFMRASDEALRAVAKCTDDPWLLAQLLSGMEVPASTLGAGGSWLSMTSWRYGTTAAAAAAMMHAPSGASDARKAPAAEQTEPAPLAASTDSLVLWLEQQLQAPPVPPMSALIDNVRDSVAVALAAGQKNEAKVQAARARAARARLAKVGAAMETLTRQVRAIGAQAVEAVAAGRRAEAARAAVRDAQRRARLAKGHRLWRGAKAMVSQMLAGEPRFGLRADGREASGSDVAEKQLEGTHEGLSATSSGLDDATLSLPGLRRVKVSRRPRTSTLSSPTAGKLGGDGARTSAGRGEATAGMGDFDFGHLWQETLRGGGRDQVRAAVSCSAAPST